jgi:hypothetical protein
MNAKKLRREFERALPTAIRALWVKLCRLPTRQRVLLAWMLLRGKSELGNVEDWK